MNTILVWLLIVGEAGGHNGASQLGPFVDQLTCERVAASKTLRKFDKECFQVVMPVGIPKP